MSDYSHTVQVDWDYDTAVEQTKDALEEHGFGVLTEIDVSVTLQEKLGVDVDDYVILGACNPEQAYKGLQEERELGLLLPCNVIVYRQDGDTYVSAINATQALGVAGNEDLQPIAEEVNQDLMDVVRTLETHD